MMKTVTCIEDLRQIARRRVPRAFFDYVEAGSYAQETLRANHADLQRHRLRQRVLIDVSARDTAATFVGEKLSVPFALGSVALTGLLYGNGEILACRAAHAAGSQYTLSTLSICSIEDVAAAVGKPFWFQLYVLKDRGFVRALIERAAAAKCSALVLTVDLPISGQRHCDIKNGLAVPPSLKFKNLVDDGAEAALGRQPSRRKAVEFRESRRSRKRLGKRDLARPMGGRPIRSDAELEGCRMG